MKKSFLKRKVDSTAKKVRNSTAKKSYKYYVDNFQKEPISKKLNFDNSQEIQIYVSGSRNNDALKPADSGNLNSTKKSLKNLQTSEKKRSLTAMKSKPERQDEIKISKSTWEIKEEPAEIEPEKKPIVKRIFLKRGHGKAGGIGQ
jgi:hypothetical protein